MEESNLQIFQYNGSAVTFRRGDHIMVSATEMAKPFGKVAAFWLNTQSSKDFIAEYSKLKKINFDDLVVVKKGSPENGGGTWMHEDVAMEFARWLSPAFAIWCNDRIKELMQFGITATPHTIDNILADPDNAIKMLNALKEERAMRAEAESKRIEAESLAKQRQLTIEAQEQTIVMQAPKVEYVDKVLSSRSTFTTTEIAAMYGMSAKRLNKALEKFDIQYKQGKMWHLYAKFKDKGYAKPSVFIYHGMNGETMTREQLEWTEQGRMFIHDKLIENDFIKKEDDA